MDERSSRLGDFSGHKKRLPITLVQIITNFNTLIWLIIIVECKPCNFKIFSQMYEYQERRIA